MNNDLAEKTDICNVCHHRIDEAACTVAPCGHQQLGNWYGWREINSRRRLGNDDAQPALTNDQLDADIEAAWATLCALLRERQERSESDFKEWMNDDKIPF